MSARASDFNGVGVRLPTAPRIAKFRGPVGGPVGISLFTGAMGWDLGLERGAGVGFLLAADSCAAARATIRANRPGILVLADACVSAAQIRNAAGLSPDDVIDVVAGCPPCRAWSKAGRRRGVADPDGMLVPRFVDLAVELRPRVVAMENVIGLASAELGGERGGVLGLVVHELRRNGYRVAHDLLDAADFGSPQDRRRLVLIASLDADPAMPEPTHSRGGANGLPRWRTLRDALEGLPGRPRAFLPYPPSLLRFYAALKAGQDWHHLPPDLQRESRGDTGRFMGGTSFCRRLAWDRPCPTLTCEPTSKTVGRCHPDEDRPLSVEEYRRVQGFADEWIICGSTVARYRQIGNAVPVELSTAVGRAVAKALGLTPPPPVRADRPIEIAPPPSAPPCRLSGTVSKKGDGVLAWLIRLPGDRCPFATDTCVRVCYAKRNFNRRHNARHERNRDFCESDRFVEQMADEVRRSATKAGDRTISVCLHGRGDFFSLAYVLKWRQVMERTSGCGNLRYYVYSRAWIDCRFRAELEAIARDFPNVRINLSADKDNSRGHGIPVRIGDGLVTWLAEKDSDLPPEGAAVDLVLRSTTQPRLPPAETLGGIRVCPNESRLYYSRRDGKVVIEDGAPVRITCGECRLCIDRSSGEWDAIKQTYRGDGSGDPATAATPATGPAASAAVPVVVAALHSRTPSDSPKFIDLCAGIGGIRLAMEAAGGVCVMSSEFDRNARRVYRANFGEWPWGDITRIMAEDVPDHDVLCAGFPCQPFSLSGKRMGFADEARGTIFFQLARIIEGKRPPAVLLENVKGLANHDGGRTFATIKGTLDRLGYRVFSALLNASRYGCPTARERVYLVALRSDLGIADFAFPEPTDEQVCLADVLLPDAETDKWVVRGRSASIDADAAARAEREVALEPVRVGLVDGRDAQGYRVYHERGHTITFCARGGGIGAKTGLSLANGRVRRLDPREGLRAMGYPDSFTVPVAIAPDQMRTLIGNSVAVPVVRMVCERVVRALSESRPAVASPLIAVLAPSRPYSVLDLFAGCGGMSTGFLQAGGFEVKAACQWDPERPAIARTYEANHPGAIMVDADITLPGTKDRICAAFRDRACDVVIGGPPCGPYSTSGRRDPNDPKARLFEHYLALIGRLQPKVAVMENVRSLLSMKSRRGGLVIDEIYEGCHRLGYEVKHEVAMAADYGVPQLRERVFIVASRLGVPIRFPAATHAEAPGPADKLLPWATMRDAIGDLKDAPEDAEAGHVFTRHRPKTIERFAKTPVGRKGCCDNYHEGYYRNPPDEPCVTIKTVAWPIHYARDRELTAREAARVQSFPESFRFVGSITARRTMVGNAVPPLLARAVASSVREMLDESAARAEVGEARSALAPAA